MKLYFHPMSGNSRRALLVATHHHAVSGRQDAGADPAPDRCARSRREPPNVARARTGARSVEADRAACAAGVNLRDFRSAAGPTR